MDHRFYKEDDKNKGPLELIKKNCEDESGGSYIFASLIDLCRIIMCHGFCCNTLTKFSVAYQDSARAGVLMMNAVAVLLLLHGG